MRRIAGFLDGVRTRAVSTGKTLVLTRDEEDNRLVVLEEDEGVDALKVLDDVGRRGTGVGQQTQPPFTMLQDVLRRFACVVRHGVGLHPDRTYTEGSTVGREQMHVRDLTELRRSPGSRSRP